ncbi:hypothetical protein DBT54_07245 [Aerococcus loyolae]|uniref:Uncharacterized protein n=1 Tax=Aerococcus urinae TaxID=1376 RepID=A0A329P0S8_9LACT|nr:hypothetical protein DBT51_07940 [Aerococcus loyolae]RAV78432.1 hypothetical protein DBT54_07245 [Aerococcus loyolae]
MFLILFFRLVFVVFFHIVYFFLVFCLIIKFFFIHFNFPFLLCLTFYNPKQSIKAPLLCKPQQIEALPCVTSDNTHY